MDHWKWYRFALEAQDVLVWGYIPGTAVLASVPLSQMFTKLPSYFLLPDAPVSPDGKDTPLARLAWDYTRKKPSYRQFCQDMSDRFLRMPVDRRLRDTTAGAVRLALSHLRPWFHRLDALRRHAPSFRLWRWWIEFERREQGQEEEGYEACG